MYIVCTSFSLCIQNIGAKNDGQNSFIYLHTLLKANLCQDITRQRFFIHAGSALGVGQGGQPPHQIFAL